MIPTVILLLFLLQLLLVTLQQLCLCYLAVTVTEKKINVRYRQAVKSLPQDWSTTLVRIVYHAGCLHTSWKDV